MLLLPLAPSLASSRFPAGMELSTGMLLLLGPRAAACRGWRLAVNMTQQMENEKRRKKDMTSGARMSVIEGRGCNEVYVFIYACSWAQVISWHFCEKPRIVMVHFKIRKL